MLLYFLPNLAMGASSAAPVAPLLPAVTFGASEIVPAAPPNPFGIDPERTTEI